MGSKELSLMVFWYTKNQVGVLGGLPHPGPRPGLRLDLRFLSLRLRLQFRLTCISRGPKIQKSWKSMFPGPQSIKFGFDRCHKKQNNTTSNLEISLSHIFHKNNSKMTNKCLNNLRLIFVLISPYTPNIRRWKTSWMALTLWWFWVVWRQPWLCCFWCPRWRRFCSAIGNYKKIIGNCR